MSTFLCRTLFNLQQSCKEFCPISLRLLRNTLKSFALFPPVIAITPPSLPPSLLYWGDLVILRSIFRVWELGFRCRRACCLHCLFLCMNPRQDALWVRDVAVVSIRTVSPSRPPIPITSLSPSSCCGGDEHGVWSGGKRVQLADWVARWWQGHFQGAFTIEKCIAHVLKLKSVKTSFQTW